MKKPSVLRLFFLTTLFVSITAGGYISYRESVINCASSQLDHHKHHLVCIVDDSICNTVFEGQIIQPLLQYQQQDPDTAIHIISFEKNAIEASGIEKIIPSQIGYNIFARYPLMGLASLWPAIYHTKNVLSSLDSYSILARGPISSYIAQQALDQAKCKKLTIQARAVIAEEYDFCTVNRSSGLMKLAHQWRLQQYHAVERAGFAPQGLRIPYEVEVVTTALKDYLVDTYQASCDHITIAQHDIPATIPAEQRSVWRKEIRDELNIPQDAYVYCYNGSSQIWQEAESTVSLFVEESQKHPEAYFVAITQSKNEFEKAVKERNLNPEKCRIFSVKHADVCKYLCACDTGLMYRVDSIVSWVARPVKVLEYQAAGLEVVHNNTVAWVKEVLAC